MTRMLASAAALLVAAACAQADIISVIAEDDNFTRDSEPTTVQNADGLLLVKEPSSESTRRKIFIKFDLAALAPDASEPATFSIKYAGSTSVGGDTVPLRIHALKTGFTPGTGILGTDWSETAIHDNNAPGNNTTGSGVKASAYTELAAYNLDNNGSNAVPAGTVFTANIATLGDFLQADKTLTIAVVLNSQQNNTPIFQFSSSESQGNEPRLSFTTIPEPASMALVAAGSLIVLRRRRA